MKIITGYLAQDGGQASVCGIDVKDHPHDTKKKIGYLPEANPLYPDMYVREYLDFVADIHKVKNKKEKIETVIGQVGLTPESTKRLGQLSKGYKQRVGLAAALIHDPEVLILDEPTSGLDPNQIVEIREVIRGLGQQKTVLFSSHILQEVEALCDRVLIINKGRLVADNTLDQLRQQDSNTVKVSFKDAPGEALLKSLKGVSRTSQPTPNQWEIETDQPENVKKQLMELALQNNLNIVSLQSENRRLEDIFRSLTTPQTPS